MDVVADLPADPQAAEPVQVGERALDNPASVAEPGAVFGAAASDQRFHTEYADQAAVLVVVVAAVTEHDVGSAPRPTALAPHWRHGLKQWDELCDVACGCRRSG